MDLELTDEQRWLSESVQTLLDREWPAVDGVAAASVERRRRVWEQLVEFGALSIAGEQGIGAVEACLIAHSLGAHLAAVPFVASAAVRLALAPASGGVLAGEDTALAMALLEPGSSWSIDAPDTELRRTRGGFVLVGAKVAVEQLDLADKLAVLAALDGEPVLVLVSASDPRIVVESSASFDAMLPMSSAVFRDTPVAADAVLSGSAAQMTLERLSTAGSLLAAAEALGAAGKILDQACRYAGERRQFGRTIGSFQSLRHILADIYVRCASGWSAVLYAAAEFDDGAAEAAQTASIAKAYVARGAREVAHGAMQVFGGIAFTAEHPAHRFLRRIIVREQQFGDAGHHERELGRRLAHAPGRTPSVLVEASSA